MPVFGLVAWLMGATTTIIGNPQARGPLLIAANHVSWTDIILVASVVPGTFIAKSDVEDWPVFGLLARLKRSLFVERGKPQNTSEFKNTMRQRLSDNEIVILFAEGTSSDGNRVLPFKSALFSAVEDESVPVQPLSIAYTGLGGLPMGRRRRPYLAWYGDM
ncbi:MAG: lysophospholipid acyltransferase family protein, partial [Hyphomicrobiales bacterium]